MFRMYPLFIAATVLAVLGGYAQPQPGTDTSKAAAPAAPAAASAPASPPVLKDTGDAAAAEREAMEIAIDAYVYGYPLVTMEYTRRVSTNVAAPEGTKAPMGHLVKLRQYPDASFK